MFQRLSNWLRGSTPEPVRSEREKRYLPIDSGNLGGTSPVNASFHDVLARRGITPGNFNRPPVERESFALVQDYVDRAGWIQDGGLRLADEQEIETFGNAQRFLSETPGGDGAAWNDGLVYNRDKTQRFLPVEGRGFQVDHGTFWQTFLECGPFRRSWTTLTAPLKTGVWRVSPPDFDAGDLPSGVSMDVARVAYERQAKYAERLLFSQLEGGWRKHINEASLALVQGVSPFVELYTEATLEKRPRLRRLQYRWPSSIVRYFVDEDETIRAIQMQNPDGGPVIVNAEHMTLYSWDEFGLDPEGNGYARSVHVWWEILQLASQLEAVTGEKFGSPWVYLSKVNTDGKASSDDQLNELRDIVNAAVASENPVIVLPDNTSINVAGASGAAPDFTAVKQFALERITEILVGESALIAVGKSGSYAARESAADAAISFAPAIASWMCDVMNGADNLRTTGALPKAVDSQFGGTLIPGLYPELEFSLGGFDDTTGVESIIAAASAGLVQVNDEVQKHVHEKLRLPAPVFEVATVPDAQAAASVMNAGVRLADIDAVRVGRQLDLFDSSLGREMTSVFAKWMQAVKDQLDDARRTNEFSPETVVAVLEGLRPQLKAQLRAAVDSQAISILRYGAETVADQLGMPIKAPGVERLVDSSALQLRSMAAVDELINRHEGLVLERFVAFARGETAISIPVLAEGTVAGVAAKITSTALNVGREAMADLVIEKAKSMGINGDVIAERSAVMDNNTCGKCRELDGARARFGSVKYFDMAPPNKCLGGDRCRCIYTYILPDEQGYQRALAALSKAS